MKTHPNLTRYTEVVTCIWCPEPAAYQTHQTAMATLANRDDRLTVTPADEGGKKTSKLKWGYPSYDYTSIAIATALFRYMSTYGLLEEVW